MANRVELPIVVLNDEAPYNPVAGASCVIFKRGTTSEVTVYSDSGATNNTITQPLSTDSAGRLSGWLARGAYDVQITIPGRTPYVEPFDAAPAKDASIDTAWLEDGSITGAKINSSAKDAAAGTASLRTLGTGSAQATAGNDSRLSNERTPTDGSVTTQKLVDGNVTEAKVADRSITSRKMKITGGVSGPLTIGTSLTSSFVGFELSPELKVTPAVASIMEIDAQMTAICTAGEGTEVFVALELLDVTTTVKTAIAGTMKSPPLSASFNQASSVFHYRVELPTAGHTYQILASAKKNGDGTVHLENIPYVAFRWRMYGA